jgi:hypothetical protein
MKLRTVVRDCLFLNWALPAEALPEPPAPLRYQRHAWQGRDYVFVSALLFHHDAVRWSAFPLLRVGYPQLNLRFNVLDEDGVPAVLFQRELMPAWVAPGVRLVSRHPAASARLDFPRPSREAGADSWSWRAERGSTLTVRAWMHSPSVGFGPRIGSWEETVRYFQERPRGYAVHGGVLHRVDVSHPPVEAVWPLAAEVGGDALLRHLLPPAPGLRSQVASAVRPQDGNGAWPALHSTWLCPEMPFSIVFDLVPKVQPVVQHLPHPAAGRVGSPAFLGDPVHRAATVQAQRAQREEPRPARQPQDAGRAPLAPLAPGAGAAGAGVLASAA